MSGMNADTKIMTVASCSNAREEHRSHVVVSGSYGGRYNAFNAAKWGVRGVIMNDAGVGRDNAGIVGRVRGLHRCGAPEGKYRKRGTEAGSPGAAMDRIGHFAKPLLIYRRNIPRR